MKHSIVNKTALRKPARKQAFSGEVEVRCLGCAFARLRYGGTRNGFAAQKEHHESTLSRRTFNAGLLAAAAGAGTSRKAFAAGDATIKIGTFGPYTGPASGLGLESKTGIQFAVQQINAVGGIDGKKIELIMYDDRADRAEAVSVVR